MTSYVSLDSNNFAIATGYIKVYQYDNDGIYIGDVDEWVTAGTGISAGATSIAPPAAESGKIAIHSNNEWSLVEDNRGATVYSIADRSASVVSYVGPIKEGFTTLKPNTDYDIWNNGAWVTDAASQKNAEILSAQNTQAELLADAKSKISIWQTELLLGDISDSDKARLTSWMNYIKDLQNLDASTAPNIIWPNLPSN